MSVCKINVDGEGNVTFNLSNVFLFTLHFKSAGETASNGIFPMQVQMQLCLLCYLIIFVLPIAFCFLFSTWHCCVVSLYDGCLFSHAEATASHIIGSALFVAAEKDIAMISGRVKWYKIL